jgi:hypothetical protein
MAIDFPSSPSLNDTYTYQGRIWVYNGTGWVNAGLHQLHGDFDVNGFQIVDDSQANVEIGQPIEVTGDGAFSGALSEGGFRVNGVTLISTNTGAVSTHDVPLDVYTGFKSFRFIIHRATPSVDGAYFQMRVSIDGGSTFLTTSVYYTTGGWLFPDATVLYDWTNGGSGTEVALSYGSNDAAYGIFAGEIDIYNPLETTAAVKYAWRMSSVDDSSALPGQIWGDGYVNSVNDVTDIRFFPSSGTINITYTLLGFR